MTKIMIRYVVLSVLFAVSNVAVASAREQTQDLKSWSTKIDVMPLRASIRF